MLAEVWRAMARVLNVPGANRCPWHDVPLEMGDEVLCWRADRCPRCAEVLEAEASLWFASQAALNEEGLW